MDRATAVKIWREVCGSDLIASLMPSGRMLEDFAMRIVEHVALESEIRPIGSREMTDERCKQIMSDLGMPNSWSLLRALLQVANEAGQEHAAAERKAWL